MSNIIIVLEKIQLDNLTYIGEFMVKNFDAKKENTEKIVKRISLSDNGPGVSCTTRGGNHYQISQNVEKMKFTLWKVVEGGFVKIATANSPLDLDEFIPWDE